MNPKITCTKACILLVLFNLVFLISVDAQASNNETLNKSFAASGYNLISATTIKTGSVKSSIKENLFSKELYSEDERPILVEVKAKCISTGKIYQSRLELTQKRDKWGEWTYGETIGDLSIVMRVLTAIDRSFPKCDTQEEVKQRIAAEQRQSGRFISSANGTVLDKQTGLMWAAKDNGKAIGWEDAKKYCESYHGGGYTNWRLPTDDELRTLYDKNIRRQGQCRTELGDILDLYVATKLIDITADSLWGARPQHYSPPYFNFAYGKVSVENRGEDNIICKRALPVRFTEESKLREEESLKKMQAERESEERKKQEAEQAAAKRFIDNVDGTITDTSTGLIWAAQSTKGNVTWEEAVSFCKRYRGRGYTDWRMPTLNELSERYDVKYRYSLNLQGTFWSSNTRGSEAACFAFGQGNKTWEDKNRAHCKATPVRSIPDDLKKELSASEWLKSGIINYKKKDFNASLHDYNKAIELDPKYIDAYYFRGNIYTVLNKSNEAINDYNKAIELNPKYEEAYFFRAFEYHRLKKNNEAINDFSRVIELNPEMADAYYSRACVYSLLENKERAIQDLSEAVKMEPDFRNKAKVDRDFDYIRNNPDFIRLIGK